MLRKKTDSLHPNNISFALYTHDGMIFSFFLFLFLSLSFFVETVVFYPTMKNQSLRFRLLLIQVTMIYDHSQWVSQIKISKEHVFKFLALCSLDWHQIHYVQKACFNGKRKQNKLECDLSTSHDNREQVHEIFWKILITFNYSCNCNSYNYM